MKKLLAILLLGILLFNWGGYRLLSHYLTIQSENRFQLVLDEEQYNDADLIHIKVPTSLPYGENREVYDRVEGSIEINGITYSYVKRRFYQDTLELLCLPNLHSTQIKNARDAFAQLANDFISHPNSSKKTSGSSASIKFNISDFTQDDLFFSWQFSRDGVAINRNGLGSQSLPFGGPDRIDHPPCTVA